MMQVLHTTAIYYDHDRSDNYLKSGKHRQAGKKRQNVEWVGDSQVGKPQHTSIFHWFQRQSCHLPNTEKKWDKKRSLKSNQTVKG